MRSIAKGGVEYSRVEGFLVVYRLAVGQSESLERRLYFFSISGTVRGKLTIARILI